MALRLEMGAEQPEELRKLIMAPEGAAVPALKPRRDDTLIKALARAHLWRQRIESGQARSITDLAEQQGVTDTHVCRLPPLTCLASDILEAILDGPATEGAERRVDSPNCGLSSPRTAA